LSADDSSYVIAAYIIARFLGHGNAEAEVQFEDTILRSISVGRAQRETGG